MKANWIIVKELVEGNITFSVSDGKPLQRTFSADFDNLDDAKQSFELRAGRPFDRTKDFFNDVVGLDLENWVGRRFDGITDIKQHLTEEFNDTDPVVMNSDSEDSETMDWQLDCSLEDQLNEGENLDFSLFYAKTRAGQYYITEVNTWGI